MSRARILPLVFLFASPAIFAQHRAVLHGPPTAAGDCPIGMQASHGVGVPVGLKAGAPAPALTQRIHLTLTNLLAHEIVSAQFVVHGFSDQARAMNLANSSQEPDLAKTLDVVLDVKGKAEASSDLSLTRFTAVTSIDLNSITYADGSTWRTPSPEACTIAPGLMMLVASAQ